MGWISVTVRKLHNHFEQAALPDGLLLAGNPAFPVLNVEDTISGAFRLRVESKRMVPAPELAVYYGFVSNTTRRLGDARRTYRSSLRRVSQRDMAVVWWWVLEIV